MFLIEKISVFYSNGEVKSDWIDDGSIVFSIEVENQMMI